MTAYLEYDRRAYMTADTQLIAQRSTDCLSHAQNAEDIILSRALSDIDRGFYIDIGAWHPDELSVTKAFYSRGWSGINVEPQRKHYETLQRRRSRDTNLQLAISDRSGPISLWVPRYSALATCNPSMLHPQIPDYADPIEHHVDTMRLDRLCQRHVRGRDIHFLKIDVEGSEARVLASADFRRFRPFIVVVEAVSPHDGKPTWHSWEPGLLEHDYQFGLFDGLNRFYVRQESSWLLQRLQLPTDHPRWRTTKCTG